MRSIVITLAVALIVGVGAPESRGAATPTAGSQEAAGGILVKGTPAMVEQSGMTAVRDVGLGWTLAKPKGLALASKASDVAKEVTEDLGLEAVPDVLFQLAAEPRFSDQWGMENTGQSGGKVDADVDILDAWKRSTGARRVVLAVLDTGIDADHPDLKSTLWSNSGEVAGNGVDDDGNGYIDDVYGWDAVNWDGDPNDTYGHGTFVASVAAADVNGVGMAGVAPDVSVMPIQVCSGSGCWLSSIIGGIGYAMANGADVANMSFGGYSESKAFEDAVRAAVDAGILVVAAAGNDGSDNDVSPIQPASFDIDGVIAVGATDRHDHLADFSNYGDRSVDLAAPGVGILGAARGGGWTTGSGTSFSTPFVSGAAALVKTTRPNAGPVEIKKLLLATVDRFGGLSGSSVTGGRLNAGAALAKNLLPIAEATLTPSMGEAPLAVVASAEKSTDFDGSIVKWRWTTPTGAFDGKRVDLVFEDTGSHDVTLELTDDSGASSSARFTVLVGSNFDDTGESVFRDAILWLSARGITAGCNPPVNDRFCPDALVTRGQMAAFFVRGFGYGDEGGGDLFVDDDGDQFESAIDRLATAGVTVGCNPPVNDRYCPDAFVTRGHMAAFFVRAMGYEDDGGGDLFADDDGHQFEAAIDRLATAGVTVGCNPPTNDRYCPDDLVTRGQMAAFFRRALG